MNVWKNTDCGHWSTNRAVLQCCHRYCTTRDSGRSWRTFPSCSRWSSWIEPRVTTLGNEQRWDRSRCAVAWGTRRDEQWSTSRLDHGRGILHSLAWITTGTAAQGGQHEPGDSCRKTWVLEEKGRLVPKNVGQFVRWILDGVVFGSQTTTWHLDVGPSHDSSRRISQILTCSTPSHTLRRSPGRVLCMTVLQSVCSLGRGLQFGDVQPAFSTGDPIKREHSVDVRVPPDGVPGESRDVWRQLLKTVNGLADATREWRNCFLAAPRGLGSETSVLEACVLVLRSHGIIWVAVDDMAGGGDEVWEQAIARLEKRFTFGHWEVGKGKFCCREATQAADGSMRFGQPAFFLKLDFVWATWWWDRGGATRHEVSIWHVRVDTAFRDPFQFFKVVSTKPRCWTFNGQIVWWDRLKHTQIQRFPSAKFLWTKCVSLSCGDVSGGSTRAEQAQAEYVVMVAD